MFSLGEQFEDGSKVEEDVIQELLYKALAKYIPGFATITRLKFCTTFLRHFDQQINFGGLQSACPGSSASMQHEADRVR